MEETLVSNPSTYGMGASFSSVARDFTLISPSTAQPETLDADSIDSDLATVNGGSAESTESSSESENLDDDRLVSKPNDTKFDAEDLSPRRNSMIGRLPKRFSSCNPFRFPGVEWTEDDEPYRRYPYDDDDDDDRLNSKPNDTNFDAEDLSPRRNYMIGRPPRRFSSDNPSRLATRDEWIEDEPYRRCPYDDDDERSEEWEWRYYHSRRVRWNQRRRRDSLFIEDKPTGLGAGLYNMGNTCFLNAIMQCFTHMVPLVEALQSGCNHIVDDRCREGFCVLCALREHVELSLASSGKCIAPSKFVDDIKHFSSSFQRNQQEDAHEFLQCLLEKLESSCSKSKEKDEELLTTDDNLVKRVFGGRLLSKLRCCNCGHYSDMYEPMIDLSLEIEGVNTLSKALESFTSVEKIEDPDCKTKCDKCEELVSREKQLVLDEAPTVAALHLKRFKSDGVTVQKIDDHVEFPLELDMSPYASTSQSNDEPVLKYRLYAVVVHDGRFSTSGHYFCYIRSAPETWHKLDDSSVYRVNEQRVLSEKAYILFYAKEGTSWFSNFWESQKPSFDSCSLRTSPKSVLETMDCGSTVEPRSTKLGNIEPKESMHTEELKKYSPSRNMVKATEDSHDDRNSTRPSIESGHKIIEEYFPSKHIFAKATDDRDDENPTRLSNESAHAQVTSSCVDFQDDTVMADASDQVKTRDDNSEVIAQNSSLCNQHVNKDGNSATPRPPITFRFKSTAVNRAVSSGSKFEAHDHLKVATKQANFKTVIKKPIRDSHGQEEACRYLRKNTVNSERSKMLMAAMRH